MHARAPITAGRKMVASDAWQIPMSSDGGGSHVRFIRSKRGGTGGTGGSGPTGYKATPRALLSRHMADRTGVALVVKNRQAVATKANKLPPKVIWPDAPTPEALAIYHR